MKSATSTLSLSQLDAQAAADKHRRRVQQLQRAVHAHASAWLAEEVAA